MPRKTDKRIRLINSAKGLIHKQGFYLTTLADIAQEADVPLGNVYYYFKTKDAIGEAVIEQWAAETADYLSKLNELTTPLERLLALLQFSPEEVELTARYGCAIGGLCQELGKQGGPLADQAAKLLHDRLAWVEEQFRTLGYSDTCKDLALEFIANIQGMHLLTHTFKDPQLTAQQTAHLERWLKSLAANKGKLETSSKLKSLEEAMV